MKVATCHTKGCENEDWAIALDFVPDDLPLDGVVCGACGQEIRDIAAKRGKVPRVSHPVKPSPFQ